MRRPSKGSPQKLSADSQRLVALSLGIVQASSRLEERGWESQLDTLLQKLLKNGHQATIDTALNNLFKLESGSYDALMEATESVAESCQIEHDDMQYDALLVALPILAWTRFSIASGPVPADPLQTLTAHLHAHVLAPDCQVAMAPTLFAIDQLPRSHVDTFALTARMALAALKGTALRQPANAPETAPFLADTRYLLAAVVVPKGAPLFRWQATLNVADRDDALTQWHAQALPTISRLLPGCGIELLLPEAYFVACREADRQIRPASIRAAVHYLTHTLALEASALQAVIGSFGEEVMDGRVDEYRVGFTIGKDPDVIYGVVWPLYGQEDEGEQRYTAAEAPIDAVISADVERKSPLEEIIALLEECGVTDIKRHTGRFPMEFCEDCGAPLYPDPQADLVHAEMPEDAIAGSTHLH